MNLNTAPNEESHLIRPQNKNTTRKWLIAVSVIATAAIISTIGCAIALSKSNGKSPQPNPSSGYDIDGKQGFLSLHINATANDTFYLHLGNLTVSNGDNACYAPPGTWGPACASGTGLSSPYANQWIYYHIEAMGDTAVFCRVSGAACPSGGPCCWAWHPRTGAGSPIWNGPIGVIWGANAGTPAITCMGSPLGSSIRWSWSAGIGPLGCFNGYNCNIPGC